MTKGGKDRVFIQLVSSEPKIKVDVREFEIKPGQVGYGHTYDELVEFGSGTMYFDEEGNRADKPCGPSKG